MDLQGIQHYNSSTSGNTMPPPPFPMGEDRSNFSSATTDILNLSPVSSLNLESLSVWDTVEIATWDYTLMLHVNSNNYASKFLKVSVTIWGEKMGEYRINSGFLALGWSMVIISEEISEEDTLVKWITSIKTSMINDENHENLELSPLKTEQLSVGQVLSITTNGWLNYLFAVTEKQGPLAGIKWIWWKNTLKTLNWIIFWMEIKPGEKIRTTDGWKFSMKAYQVYTDKHYINIASIEQLYYYFAAINSDFWENYTLELFLTNVTSAQKSGSILVTRKHGLREIFQKIHEIKWNFFVK